MNKKDLTGISGEAHTLLFIVHIIDKVDFQNMPLILRFQLSIRLSLQMIIVDFLKAKMVFS